MDSKGQIEQVLTHILFILIAGFLLTLGYVFISGLQSDNCQAQRITFTQDIIGFIDRYDDYGSRHEERISLPCEYQYVCFVDSAVYEDGETLDVGANYFTDLDDKRAVLQTAEDVQKNIFLVGEFAEPIGYSEKLITGDNNGGQNILCVEGDYADLVFKGQGEGTLVEEG